MINLSLKNCSLRIKAYKDIKNKIIYLDLNPGEKIFENEIVKTLKISRTPVREALLMLENEKLVECHPKLGFIVRRLPNEEVEEYFSIRRILEAFAVVLIIERITASEIESLKRNIMEAEKNVERNDLRNIIRCETEFHEILYRSTKSEIFYRTISGLVDKFQWIRAIALVTPGGSRESLDHHKKILAAIERKDSEKHKELMELHLQRAAETYALSPVTNLLNRNLKGKLGK